MAPTSFSLETNVGLCLAAQDASDSRSSGSPRGLGLAEWAGPWWPVFRLLSRASYGGGSLSALLRPREANSVLMLFGNQDCLSGTQTLRRGRGIGALGLRIECNAPSVTECRSSCRTVRNISKSLMSSSRSH